jgi:hypothetical protein
LLLRADRIDLDKMRSQLNELRHKSSMGSHSHFHRKKIGRSLLMAYVATKQRASAAPSIAEIPQRAKNYCGASLIFAETSRIAPESYAAR